jgi:uncharacterized protein (DUF1697 family)
MKEEQRRRIKAGAVSQDPGTDRNFNTVKKLAAMAGN